MVDPQAPERILQRRGDGLRRAIQPPLPVLAAEHAFAGQHEFVPPVHQRATQQFLIGAEPVERGGVEEIDAPIERVQQQLFRVARLGPGKIGVAEVHAAKADGRYGEGTDGAGRGRDSHGRDVPLADREDGSPIASGGSRFQQPVTTFLSIGRAKLLARRHDNPG